VLLDLDIIFDDHSGMRYVTSELPTVTDNSRATDADRACVASVISQAYSDGRLDSVEMDHLTSSVWTCKTIGELVELVSDLNQSWAMLVTVSRNLRVAVGPITVKVGQLIKPGAPLFKWSDGHHVFEASEGQIAAIFVTQGQSVRKGSPLVRILTA